MFPCPKRVLAPVLLLAALACGRGEEPPHLLYSSDAQSLENPFPDLRLLRPDGFVARERWYEPFTLPELWTPRMVRLLETWAEGVRDARGVGSFGPTLVRASTKLDPSSLAGVAHRLRKTSNGYEVLERDVAVEHSFAMLDGTGLDVPADFPEFLFVRPSVVLPDGEEGLLVFTRGLKTDSGELLGRGFEFEDADASEDRIRGAARALDVEEDDILLALPLRAERVLDSMRAFRDWTVDAPAPSYTLPEKALVEDGNARMPVGRWRPSDADWNVVAPVLERWIFSRPASALGLFAQGTFKSRELRENGIVRPEWLENPSSAPEQELRFVLTLPPGPKPASGYRVVIGAHGLNGQNSVRLTSNPPTFCGEVAVFLAQRGLGCLGLDAASHGSRGSSFDFFAVEDVRKIRDNFRQSTYDLLQLTRMASTLDVDGDGTPDIAPELGFFGNSLGGIMGASLMSFDPRLRYGMLNVGGGGLSNILAGTQIRDRVGLLVVAETGIEFSTPAYYGMFPLFRTAAQLVLDAADPTVHAQALAESDVPVVLQEGLNDGTIPNFTSEELARSAGLEPVESAVPAGGVVRALVRVDPARFLAPDQAVGYNGHNIFWHFGPVQTQVGTFLESSGTQLVILE